jgi:proprotein convertase subtilisin/kexin type 5
VLSVNYTYYKHLGANTCGQTCPNGQFISVSIPNICQLCSPECIYCVDNAKKCLNKSSCATGYFYLSTNSSCLAICPDGYYANSTTQQCTYCDTGCSTCTAPGNLYCTTCRIDTSVVPNVPYYKLVDYTICNTSCPNGYYEKLPTLTCELCHPSCSLCDTGPEDCQQCKNNSGIIYLNYGNKCLQKCPDGFYGDPLDNKCKSCH